MEEKIIFSNNKPLSVYDMERLLQIANIDTENFTTMQEDGNKKVPSSVLVEKKLGGKLNVGDFESQFNKSLEAVEKTYFLEKIYPIGSVYITTVAENNPETFFGGMWREKSVLESSGLYMWERMPSCCVKFETNGAKKQVANIYLNVGQRFEKPIVEKDGYKLGGWYKDSNLRTPWNFSTDVVSESITLYAKWEINEYAIFYNPDSDSPEGNPTKYTIETPVTSLLCPTKNGYRFLGWREGSEDGKEISQIGGGRIGTLDLYAAWEKNNYSSRECFNCHSKNIIAHSEVPSASGMLYECLDCHSSWRI